MHDRPLHQFSGRLLLTAILIATALVFLPRPAPAEDDETEPIPEPIPAPASSPLSPHFPKPPALHASVEFWKRMFTEFGVGDFVLHDRDNLNVIYDVVQVSGTTNERHAQVLAKREVERAHDLSTPPSGCSSSSTRTAESRRSLSRSTRPRSDPSSAPPAGAFRWKTHSGAGKPNTPSTIFCGTKGRFPPEES